MSGGIEMPGANDRSGNMRLICSLSGLLAVGLLVLSIFVIYKSHQDVEQQRLRSDADLVQAVAHDVARNFGLVDLSLQGFLKGLNAPELDHVSPSTQRMILFDHSVGAEYISHVAYMDRSGYIRRDSDLGELPTISFADRDYFIAHENDSTLGLFVSHPMISRIYPGARVIALSRRASNPDGSFAGIVAAFIDNQYFGSLFNNLQLGSQDAFAVFHEDGTLYMRKPYRLEEVGRDMKSAELFNYFPHARAGHYDSDGAITDKVQRSLSFSRIGNYPLAIVIGPPKAQIYAAWQARSSAIVLVVGLLILTMMVLAWMLGRELQRRSDAERKLAASAAQLSIVAATDALTGIANRRRLEDLSGKEFERARRDQTSISLLIIDVDNFKQFNDTFGHWTGDQALISVARCIDGCIRRPGDFCARYGGEEFVVILPATPQAGAFKIAEEIRAAIVAEDIKHPRQPNGVLTVSIGLASLIPQKSDGFGALFGCADAALYDAKRNGRNKTIISISAHAAMPLERAS